VAFDIVLCDTAVQDTVHAVFICNSIKLWMLTKCNVAHILCILWKQLVSL